MSNISSVLNMYNICVLIILENNIKKPIWFYFTSKSPFRYHPVETCSGVGNAPFTPLLCATEYKKNAFAFFWPFNFQLTWHHKKENYNISLYFRAIRMGIFQLILWKELIERETILSKHIKYILPDFDPLNPLFTYDTIL